ncbi:methyltransferase [Patescibacteria group bacterium]|nr:methyltransferase [Patescibacteria group bacterium]
MNRRERVLKALRHEESDRVPVDLGAMMATGIMSMAYNKLKEYLGIEGGKTRIYDIGQQLAEPEMEILEVIGADVLPVLTKRGQLKASGDEKWKKSKLPDGSQCEVPEWFNPEILPDGSQVLRDDTGRITSKMPANGYYFDGVYHPLEDISTIEEMEEKTKDFLYGPIDEENVQNLHKQAKHLYETTDYALMLNGAGSIYEWAQDLRGWDKFMMDLAGNPKFAGALLDILVEAHIKRLEKILPAVEGYVQIVQTGDDLGMQDGPQLSPQRYREVVKPRHKRLYRYIKQHSSADLFLHTCGSVYEFIPDFIEMGIDILNPVQVSARDMDTKRLKEEFGKDIVFWGGGCDTQKVLPFGTPKEVEEEVKRRIEDLAPGGGFVFNQSHNIQVGVPPQNIMAMYEAVKKYGRYK